MTQPLLERLRDEDPEQRRSACVEAADDPSAVVWLDALIETLSDPDKKVVRAASDAIVQMSGRAPEAERLLRLALREADARGRWGATFTLARLAPPEPGLLPPVVEAMASPDGDVRWAAARLLVDMGRIHTGVLPVVIGLVRGAESPVVRRMATFCLRELAPDDPAAAAALLEASRDPAPGLRRAALTALAALIDPARAVWDRLADGLASDPDPAVRNLCAAAIGELGARDPSRVPTALHAAIEDAAAERGARDAGLQRAAVRALERLGRRAGPGDARTRGPLDRSGDLHHEP